MITGYYEGGGQSWDYGEIPTCHYCGTSKQSMRASNISGINICFADSCINKHVAKEFEIIRHIDDGKAKCEMCEEVKKYDVKTWDGGNCPECVELYDEAGDI